MTTSGAPKVDQLARRILAHIAVQAPMDEVALAASLGVSPEVVSARLERLREAGVLRRIRADLDLSRTLEGATGFEVLMLGSAGSQTDHRAIGRLCGSPGVVRVFSLAGRQSLGFVVHGASLQDAEQRAARLAELAGLHSTVASPILHVFHDEPGARLTRDVSDIVPA